MCRHNAEYRNLNTHFRQNVTSHVVACKGKGKGKFHPRTGYEGPEGEYRYSSILSLTSSLVGVGGQRHAPAALPPGKPGTHCTGGWVSPRTGLEGVENLAPTGIRSADRPARSESLY